MSRNESVNISINIRINATECFTGLGKLNLLIASSPYSILPSSL